MNFFAKLILFYLVMLVVPYWYLWYKMGSSIIRDIFRRIKGDRKKMIVSNPEIKAFLQKMGYSHFYVVDSEPAYGMAHPFSNEVLVSSKIYNSNNLNLIKYVLVHEIVHKKQGNTKAGVLFFAFWVLAFPMIDKFLKPSWFGVIVLGIIVGEIIILGQRKFEDLADREAARILGAKNVKRALGDIFKMNKNSTEKRSKFKNLFLIGRDFPGRLQNIGLNG